MTAPNPEPARVETVKPSAGWPLIPHDETGQGRCGCWPDPAAASATTADTTPDLLAHVTEPIIGRLRAAADREVPGFGGSATNGCIEELRTALKCLSVPATRPPAFADHGGVTPIPESQWVSFDRAEVLRLKGELAARDAGQLPPARTSQTCPRSVHRDWWHDGPELLPCPWCASDALREQLDEAVAALTDLVVKATPYGTQDGEFVATYILPTGPIHRAIPLLQEQHGIAARPGFDPRKDAS